MRGRFNIDRLTYCRQMSSLKTKEERRIIRKEMMTRAKMKELKEFQSLRKEKLLIKLLSNNQLKLQINSNSQWNKPLFPKKERISLLQQGKRKKERRKMKL